MTIGVSPNFRSPLKIGIKNSDEMRFLSHGNQSLNDGSYSPQYSNDPSHTLIDSERALFTLGGTRKLTPPLREG